MSAQDFYNQQGQQGQQQGYGYSNAGQQPYNPQDPYNQQHHQQQVSSMPSRAIRFIRGCTCLQEVQLIKPFPLATAGAVLPSAPTAAVRQPPAAPTIRRPPASAVRCSSAAAVRRPSAAVPSLRRSFPEHLALPERPSPAPAVQRTVPSSRPRTGAVQPAAVPASAPAATAWLRRRPWGLPRSTAGTGTAW